MDLQYVEDVAESFVRCLLAPLEGARVFNLEGTVVSMGDFIQTLERQRPGASKLITAGGSPVPVAYRMDGSRLRSQVPDIPQTSLDKGISQTLDLFAHLAARGLLKG